MSMEQAVVVVAPNEFVGVRAEYAWLSSHFPGYKRTSQALARNAGRSYDILDVELPSGSEFKVYFDISGFFGKLK